MHNAVISKQRSASLGDLITGGLETEVHANGNPALLEEYQSIGTFTKCNLIKVNCCKSSGSHMAQMTCQLRRGSGIMRDREGEKGEIEGERERLGPCRGHKNQYKVKTVMNLCVNICVCLCECTCMHQM